MKKAIAFSALPLVFLFVTAFQSSNSVPGQLAAIQAKLDSLEAQVAALDANGPRQFYLTKTNHAGDQALSACAPGYHMASLWEIHDTSNLRYNTELGLTFADSGSGPPVFFGWVRTGLGSVPSGSPGVANCNAWTSASNAEFGSAVRPDSGWRSTNVNTVSPWNSAGGTCDNSVPVWCVQD